MAANICNGGTEPSTKEYVKGINQINKAAFVFYEDNKEMDYYIGTNLNEWRTISPKQLELVVCVNIVRTPTGDTCDFTSYSKGDITGIIVDENAEIKIIEAKTGNIIYESLIEGNLAGRIPDISPCYDRLLEENDIAGSTFDIYISNFILEDLFSEIQPVLEN